METYLKPLIWIAGSKRDLKEMPEEVQDIFGYALHLAQSGDMHLDAKPLSGFGGAGVIEVVEDYRNNTYRAVYTVKYENAIYVLHCFQKKSKTGIKTPKPDMDKIRDRLKSAQDDAKGSGNV